MTPQEKANQLLDKLINPIIYLHAYPLCFEAAKECALITVDEIINSNPHSNPMNTDGFSTMAYWKEVKHEIENI